MTTVTIVSIPMKRIYVRFLYFDHDFAEVTMQSYSYEITLKDSYSLDRFSTKNTLTTRLFCVFICIITGAPDEMSLSVLLSSIFSIFSQSE